MKEVIATRVSTKELVFEPGGQPAEFDVTVLNNSDRFATFQVEVQAAGAENNATRSWYRLSPEICTKKPPGDSTRFSIQLTDLPKPGFVGLMNLTVRVFSLELRDIENRQVLRLKVPGVGVAPPELKFPSSEFRGEPGDRIKIPVSVTNSTRQPATIILRLRGLDSTWFPDGIDQIVQLSATETEDVVFWCELPPVAQAPSGIYRFTIEASQPQAMIVQVQGSLTILPQGRLVFRCHPPVQRIPYSLRTWKSLRAKTGEYRLSVDNQSNLKQVVRATVTEHSQVSSVPAVKWIRAACDRFKLFQLQPRTPRLELIPEETIVEIGTTETMRLTVHQRRPWLGGIRHRRFQTVLDSDSKGDIQSDSQSLELHILPIVPLWLQLSGGVALLFLIWWYVAALLQVRHTAPVNSVRLNGVANQVISASSDRTIQEWQVQNNQVRSQGVLGQSNKAVRVVRYRPINNDQVAVGYENGEMQIWDLRSKTESPVFQSRVEDRVFDLVYRQDARSLFSGHASGSVVQWTLEPNGLISPDKPRTKQVGFAVNALALVGTNQSHLAIAGRFNQLTLWDLNSDRLTPIPYGDSSERNYIFSLASSSQKPFLLATADNRGWIRLWDLRPCLMGNKACELKDEWTADSGAVRAIAFSEDGCFLVSAGDTGHAKLWSLTSSGNRRRQDAAGRVIHRSAQALNAIDLLRVQNELIVTSGGDDFQVNLFRVQQPNPECR